MERLEEEGAAEGGEAVAGRVDAGVRGARMSVAAACGDSGERFAAVAGRRVCAGAGEGVPGAIAHDDGEPFCSTAPFIRCW